MAKSLKRIIFMNLQKLAMGMIAVILMIALLLQIRMVQSQVRDSAQATFFQIEQILKENQEELNRIKEEYRESCLSNAETIAYMIQHNPDIIGDLQEFRMLARMVQVDEIHIFNKEGCIFTGTHPEYYGYTFDTGEQIGFFKPMLQDKTLRLCQDITPNTAEGKLVQYSALWSPDGEFIVEVGMYPETVLKATEKNELSHIFSLLQGSPGIDYYAVDPVSGEIMGCTTGGDNGKNIEQIGFSMKDMATYQKGAYVTVSGVDSYCIFTEMEQFLIGYVVSADQLYANIPFYTVILFIGLVLISLVMEFVVWKFTERYIINSILIMNRNLQDLAKGDLEKQMDVTSSLEFSELSSHINEMIKSLLSSTDKLSVVLNRTKLRIGVYEYNKKVKTIRFTEQIPRILDLDEEELSLLTSDVQQLRSYIDRLCQNPVPGEKNVFHFSGKREGFVKLEEIENGNDLLGIVMDVTDDIVTRRRIEQERDIDLLTGLYNRRGMERIFADIFGSPELTQTEYGVLIVIDSDDLKGVNDAYGHGVGDQYIKAIADRLCSLGTAKKVAARQGGDEFVLLLYGYKNETDLYHDLNEVFHMQKHTRIHLEHETDVQVCFSMGYVFTKGRKDYLSMISEADVLMYDEKRRRKAQR